MESTISEISPVQPYLNAPANFTIEKEFKATPLQAGPLGNDGITLVATNLFEASKALEEVDQPAPVRFWHIKGQPKKEATIIIRMERFYKFLNSKGFYKLYQGKGKVFVRVDNNIIRYSSVDQIKDFVRTYVENLPKIIDEPHQITREDLLEKLYKGSSTYLNEGNLAFLPELKSNFMQDTKDTAFIYYKNCFVKITAPAIAPYHYKHLKGYIWEDKIQDREFTLSDSGKPADFETLLWNTCNHDQARFDAARSAIGYLLHSYKDPALTKAVIFADEKIAINDQANGGTCKSLVGMGIMKLKSTWYRGKEYRIQKPFPYQGITPATQICLLDDIPKDFNFEMIFTNITNALTVEGKGQPAYTIDFKDSPKWLLTTNYAVQGEGSSFDRRRHVVEFSDHYNNHPSPLEEFGRRLFDDWQPNDWLSFDNFMLQCLQFYLANSLQEVRVNFEERKLLQDTTEELVDFMDALAFNMDYELKALKEDFCTRYEDYARHLSTKKFCKWIRSYIKFKKIRCQGDVNAAKNQPFESRNGMMYLKMLCSTPD